MTMRERFYGLAAEALDDDPRVAMVFAEIGVGEMPEASAACSTSASASS